MDYAESMENKLQKEWEESDRQEELFDADCKDAETDLLDVDNIELFQDVIEDYFLGNREAYRILQGIIRNNDALDYCYQLQKMWPEIVRAYKELMR